MKLSSYFFTMTHFPYLDSVELQDYTFRKKASVFHLIMIHRKIFKLHFPHFQSSPNHYKALVTLEGLLVLVFFLFFFSNFSVPHRCVQRVFNESRKKSDYSWLCAMFAACMIDLIFPVFLNPRLFRNWLRDKLELCYRGIKRARHKELVDALCECASRCCVQTLQGDSRFRNTHTFTLRRAHVGCCRVLFSCQSVLS